MALHSSAIGGHSGYEVTYNMLGICPRGNHRDDDIATVSMIYYVFIEYPLKTTCIDW
jgi:hypothetical protein